MQSQKIEPNFSVETRRCSPSCALAFAALDENKRLRQENAMLNQRLHDLDVQYSKAEVRGPCPEPMRRRSHARTLVALRNALFKNNHRQQYREWEYPSQSSVPIHISCLSLENLILNTASTKIANIQRVIIEPDTPGKNSDGANWRVSGIASGKADPEAAHEAIRNAARRFAAWKLVEDDSPLIGRSVHNLVSIEDRNAF